MKYPSTSIFGNLNCNEFEHIELRIMAVLNLSLYGACCCIQVIALLIVIFQFFLLVSGFKEQCFRPWLNFPHPILDYWINLWKCTSKFAISYHTHHMFIRNMCLWRITLNLCITTDGYKIYVKFLLCNFCCVVQCIIVRCNYVNKRSIWICLLHAIASCTTYLIVYIKRLKWNY